MRFQLYPDYSPQRFQAVDSLRGLAAVFVLLYHLVLHFDQQFGFTHWQAPEWMELFRYGPHVFFMISGFVIFLTIDRMKDAKSFMIARLIRLIPVFWVVLLIASVVRVAWGPFTGHVELLDVFVNALFLQGLTDRMHIDGAYWTLLVEMTFYALSAIFIYLLGLGNRITWLLFGWSVVSFVGMLKWGTWDFPMDIFFAELMISRYSMFFVVGVLMYLSIKNGQLNWPQRLIMSYSIGIMLLAHPLWIGFTLNMATLVLWFAIKGRLDWLLCYKPLLWLGALSYPLYLIHQNVGITLMTHLRDAGISDAWTLTAAIALSLVLAQALYTLVEVPSRRYLRSRYLPKH